MIKELFKSATARFHGLYVFFFFYFLFRFVLAFLFYCLLVLPGAVDVDVLLWPQILGCVLGGVGSWLLLRGRRGGLWLFLLSLVALTFAKGVPQFADWHEAVKILVGIGVLCFIFFWLKKDGRTAWQALE